jgi:hypothetical protein
MFSCPFAEFSHWIGQLLSKKPDTLLSRSFQILNDPTLVQRVNRETRGDIVGYRVPPSTRRAPLSLMRLVSNSGQRYLPSQFFAKYPLLFHPFHTSSSLSGRHPAPLQRSHSSIGNVNDLAKGFNIAQIQSRAVTSIPHSCPTRRTPMSTRGE